MAVLKVCGLSEGQRVPHDMIRWAKGDPRRVLASWKDATAFPLYVVSADDEAFPLLPSRARDAIANGNTYLLDYRLLQSLVSRRPDLTLQTLASEENAGGTGNDAGSGRSQSENKRGGASIRQPRAVTTSRRLARQKGRNTQGRQSGGIGGAARVKVTLTYLPEPDPRDIARVRRMFERLVDLAISLDERVALEAFPRRFNWSRLAVRGRTAQIARARRWERVGAMPQVLLALDTSGSMSAYVKDLLTLGMAVSHAVPDVLIMDAWNGWYGAPLAVVDEYPVAAVWQGKLWSLNALRDAGHPMPDEAADEQSVHQAWLWVAHHFRVRLGIFLSDWEDLNIVPGLVAGGVKQVWVLSNMFSSWLYPTFDKSNWRNVYPKSVARHVKRVVGCGSINDFFTALEMLLT